MAGETNRSGPEHYSEGVTTYIEILRRNPETPIVCVHGGEYAVGIYDLPKGCAVFPGVTAQPLCPQHVLTGGDIGGMHLVVDLTVGAAWSDHIGDTPDYWITEDPVNSRSILAEYTAAA